jgi:HK97 family phage major capsid protein
MNVGNLVETLKKLVPKLTDDEAEKIGSVLRLSMGDSADEPDVEGVTDQMRSYFGLDGEIDAMKALADLDTILNVIAQVCDLDEDKLARTSAVLQLALAQEAAQTPQGGNTMDEDLLMEEEYEEEDEYEEEYDEDEEEYDEDELEEVIEVDEDEMRAIIANAVDEYDRNNGRQSTRPARSFRRTYPQRSVPPFQWDSARREDSPMTGRKAAAMLRFQGGNSAAIKSIAGELYGMDYEMKRYDQAMAFGKMLRMGEKALDRHEIGLMRQVILTPNQIKAYAVNGVEVYALKADMSDVVDQLGGLLVPEDFRTDMVERLPGMTVVRGLADVLQTGSDMMTRVVVTGGNDRRTSAITTTWVGDVPTDDSARTRPTFGVERTPIHITMAVVRVPRSLMEDTPFPLVQKINEWVSQAFAIDEDEQFLIGNGIAKPEGILPSSANGRSITEVVSGHATSINSLDGIKGVRYGIARQYRSEAAWVMNDATALIVSKIKDGEGRYMWEPSNQVGDPDLLYGHPVHTSEAMPDVAASAYPIIFGNFRQGYQIADRVGMSVVRDDVSEAESDLIKFIFRRRLGGQVKGTWPFAVMKISAS